MCSLKASDLIASKLEKFDDKPDFKSISHFKGDDPVTFTGKSCQVSKSFGKATTDIYGADPFSLNLGAVLGSGILPGQGSGSATVQLAGDVVGNATAVGGK